MLYLTIIDYCQKQSHAHVIRRRVAFLATSVPLLLEVKSRAYTMHTMLAPPLHTPLRQNFHRKSGFSFSYHKY